MNSNSSFQVASSNDSNENSEGEDQDESSSQHYENVEDSLLSFREEWQKELQILKYHKLTTQNKNIKDDISEDNYETKAKNLFLRGIEMERIGKVYEAIQFYRRAVQLVPDIEFRLDECIKNRTRTDDDDNQDHSNISTDGAACITDVESDDELSNQGTLLQKIQRKMNKYNFICLPKIEQKEMHISTLPMEIFLYILRWVVSSDLDLRSLEMFSQVCRGFYLCARDPEIWKSACERAWGLNCGNLIGLYSSWREMFLERTRLHFNGCYIGKTTYIRQGESSFQDQFYRPWHLVAYYRYLRFFPDGLVLMLTTADEPSQCVSLLKYRHAKGPSILTGHYRVKDDTVTILIHRQESVKPSYRRGRRKETTYDNGQQTFHLELKIQNQNRKKHNQLVWKRYSVHTCNKNGIENNCTFDLVGNNFPPLWFSRVKSYTAESENPLQ